MFGKIVGKKAGYFKPKAAAAINAKAKDAREELPGPAAASAKAEVPQLAPMHVGPALQPLPAAAHPMMGMPHPGMLQKSPWLQMKPNSIPGLKGIPGIHLGGE